MSKELRIVAPFHNLSGYAKAARGLLAAALVAGFTVEAVENEVNTVIDYPVDGPPLTRQFPRFGGRPIPECQMAELQAALATRVSVSAPTVLMGNPGTLAGWHEYCEGPRIGYTMLESDTLHPLWAQACRNVDLILAPSRWCVETIRRAVPGVPVELLPICVDERLWSTEGERARFPKQPAFLFLSVFSTCERKGWRKTLQAFAEEFRGEDVGLVLKPSRVAEVEELADWCRSMGAWIEIVKGELTDDEMGELYRSADLYVSPGAEGFGVPCVEGALCGVASAGLAAGGAADIVSVRNGYPVAVEWEACVGQLPQIYSSAQRWPTCLVGELREALRLAYEEEPKIHLGAQARRDALNTFSRKAVADRLNELDFEELWPEPLSEPRTRKKTPPFVAVVTTHNNLESTKRIVRSLHSTAPMCNIVLADDGSTDGTAEWAVREGAIFLPCDTGGNVSRNRQIAVEYIHANPGSFPMDPVIVFFDNDIELLPGWWETLSGVLYTQPEIGILAPRKVYGDGGFRGGAGVIDGCRAPGDVQNIGNRLQFNGGSFPMFLERPLVYPDYVESACMVVRPEVWRACAWDDQFPIFYEDADYCFQAREAAWDVCATNSATVIHHAHTTSHGRVVESETNRLRFLMKWKERV